MSHQPSSPWVVPTSSAAPAASPHPPHAASHGPGPTAPAGSLDAADEKLLGHLVLAHGAVCAIHVLVAVLMLVFAVLLLVLGRDEMVTYSFYAALVMASAVPPFLLAWNLQQRRHFKLSEILAALMLPAGVLGFAMALWTLTSLHKPTIRRAFVD